MQATRPLTRGLYKWGEQLNSDIKISIERHWRDYVINSEISPQTGKKCYILSMFPYPSGNLHMGHVRVYTISDSIARFKKMSGMQTIHPMGWDAFGLPAENAAIEREVQPCDWTKQNIDRMRKQLFDLGCAFDGNREVNTSDPSYYKWTQYLFLELYKAGLAYKKQAYVNWDPVDQTVLAEEQVDANGCSWRSGAKVEKRLLNQWFIRTTYFAKQLYDGLEDPGLLGWKDIIEMQRHWIGECNGISVDFSLNYDGHSSGFIKTLTGWTDKPESLLYAEFIAVPLKSFLNKPELISSESNIYKKLSITATNPITNVKLPIYLTDEIEYAEGIDAYIGSPVIRQLDEQFASAAELSIKDYPSISNLTDGEIEKVRRQVCDLALSKNVGGYPVSSKLKDWLISRQRYWGTPIPIVYCKSCGPKPIDANSLPVALPHIKFCQNLRKSNDWICTTCPECGKEAVRETDTMDTFVDSSWYYLRYLDPENKSAPFSSEVASKLMPVDLYIGGKEHAVLHLYYARFMSHFLHSIGKLPQKEPFRRLLVQGMVRGRTFRIRQCGKYIPESQVRIIDEKNGIAVTSEDNLPVDIEWEKMSKSKHNGVDPSDMFREYGCDTTRLLMLADVSPHSFRNWSSQTFPGILNWQDKIWKMINEFMTIRENVRKDADTEQIVNSKQFKDSESFLWNQRNFLIGDTTFSFNYTNQLNVVISRLQTLTNRMKKTPKNFIGISREYELAMACKLIMLSPIAPHFACELWTGFLSAENRINTSSEVIDWSKDVLEQKWPVVDSNFHLDLLVFLNGSHCCNVKFTPDELHKLTKEKALEIALENPKLKKSLKNNNICQSSFHIYEGCRGFLKVATISEMNIKKNDVESLM